MQDSWQEANSMDHGKSFVGYSHNIPGTPFSGQGSTDGLRLNPLSWNGPMIVPVSSSEGSAAPSQSRSSASSVVISPGDGGSCPEANASAESSDQSGSVLKEHDYIGMAEVSSSSAMIQAPDSGAGTEKTRSGDLNLEETDLRLGLGPLKEPLALLKMAPRAMEQKKGELMETKDSSSTHAAQHDARKEAAWPERPQVVNQCMGLGSRGSQDVPKPEWAMADAQRERQAASDLQQRNGGQESRYAFVDNASEKRSLIVHEVPSPQNVWQAQTLRNAEGPRVSARDFPASQVPLPGQEFDAARSAVYPGARVMVSTPKNGVKRGYSEAMADGRFNPGENRNAMYEAGAGASMVVKSGLQLQESELKALPQHAKHQPSAFLPSWAASKPPVPGSWHVGLEQSGGSYSSLQNSKTAGAPTPRSEKAADSTAASWENRSKTHDALENSRHSMLDNQQSAPSDAPPPAKGQVVGWPPIRSYRKNTLAAHPKPAGDGECDGAGQSTSAIFVKVNMDGVPIGRKLDLNAHNCYEGLLLALEDMFQRSSTGQGASQVALGRENLGNDGKQLRLLNSSEFVLTYEDKEGDWMLVGDVPWGMFVNTVRRLRIMRGSEATGLAPRGLEKSKCHV